MKIIDGKKIADKILTNVSYQVSDIKCKLAVILVGKNPASRLYISIKEKRAKQIGIGFKKYLLPEQTNQTEIIKLIEKLNQDKTTTAILVQLPLPQHLNTHKIISTLDSQKDADGIHPKNLTLLKKGKLPPVVPATTSAILAALKSTRLTLKNKSIAIVGKSEIVGLPTYYCLKSKIKHIKLYDSKTKNLAQKTSQADILIVAIGKPKFITQEYIKQGAVVIDVGISKIHNKTMGDVDFASVKNKVAWITPVPGGIGPITVSMLLKNVLSLSK